MKDNEVKTIDKQEVSSNLIWRLLERFGAQGVTFVVSVVLARILDPAVYGTVALITVFTTIMQVFVDSGMGNALIQKKDADDLDFSSVFYMNIILCVALYLMMFFSAPYISSFYNRPELTPMIRVLSLVLIVSGIKNIQQAYVSKHLLFRKFFFATLGGTIGAAIIGIWMAYKGFGVWALIAQNLFNLVVDTIILWITVKWRPKMMFSFDRIKGLFQYGWKLLVSSLLDVGYRDLRSLIIGKLYTSEDLAFYNKGQQFPQLIVVNINSSIDSVLLPTMSSAQDDKEKVKSMMRRSIKTSSYLMLPMMVGLAVCAESLVAVILTEKWLPSVFFMRIFCFTFSLYPIHTANLNAIKAMGRSDLFLKLEILKKIVGIVALVCTMFISVEAMALSLLVTSILSQIINAWPNKRLLDYHYFDQIKDMFPQICLSAIMGGIVYSINLLHMSYYITLVVQIPLGVAIYILGSKLIHIDSYDYVMGIVKSYMNEKRKRG